MGLIFPYTYISCPCSDRANDNDDFRLRPSPLFSEQPQTEDSQEEEAPFDPKDPRANFSLFPPEHLLYCGECYDIRCPRCIIEEQISYFCTSCLFETPSSAVRSEGNRCARNCFNCPICFSQLSVNSINGSAKDGPWILNCNYCMWTSLEIGIKFDRPTNIRAQLDKIANGGKPKSSSKPPELPDFGRRPSHLSREPYSQTSLTATTDLPPSDQEPHPENPLDPASRFAALKSFYKTQLASTSASGNDPTHPSSISGEFSYSSPSSLTRIMNLYSTSGSFLPKKKPKPTLMREALSPSEGLLVVSPKTTTTKTTTASYTYSKTPSLAQLSHQTTPTGGQPSARHVTELRPIPAPLTSKRTLRCKTCRQILVKPEPKPTSMRHRIKLVALAYIPHISLTPLLPGPAVSSGGEVLLEPGKPTQWVLRLTNPLFDAVRVSIATAAVTPGKWPHRVTVLCPQFEVGESSDLWDEALGEKKDASRGVGGGGGGVAEAGKVYERGRNWTSVVLEVVPAAVGGKAELGMGGEDEDVLEIPIRVRLEWRQADLHDGASKKAKLLEEGADDGRRELAYWMVLGVGRVKT